MLEMGARFSLIPGPSAKALVLHPKLLPGTQTCPCGSEDVKLPHHPSCPKPGKFADRRRDEASNLRLKQNLHSEIL